MDWKSEDNYLHGVYKKATTDGNTKIAAYDLDHTIIKPTNNRTFSENDSDWEFFTDEVPKKLAECHKQGYTIVIVSNQKNISKGKPSKEVWKKKLDKIVTVGEN